MVEGVERPLRLPAGLRLGGLEEVDVFFTCIPTALKECSNLRRLYIMEAVYEEDEIDEVCHNSWSPQTRLSP